MNIKVNKDNNSVIYKQDIIKDGKLTVVGVFLILFAFTVVLNYLQDNIVDKDKVN